MELKAINKQLEKLEELIKNNHNFRKTGTEEEAQQIKNSISAEPSIDDFISGKRRLI